MELQELKEIVENKFSVNLSEKNRKRHVVYCKKIYINLAHSLNKYTLAYIGKIIDMPHDNVIYHLKRFEDLDDLHKQGYNEIVKEYRFNSELLHIKQKVKFLKKKDNTFDLPAYIVEHLKNYTQEQLLEVYATRLKPYKKMQDSKITDLDLIEKQLNERKKLKTA
jgi:hypothetical protein